MAGRVRKHLTYANVVATIALFLALGGGVAWALAKNSVKSKHIANGQVKDVDIEDSDEVSGSEELSVERMAGFRWDDFAHARDQDSTDAAGTDLIYGAHEVNTSSSTQQLDFGSVVLKFVAANNTFQVCNEKVASAPTVIELGATRTTETIGSSPACTGNKVVPTGEDFTVRSSGAIIFGVPLDSSAPNFFQIFGFSSL